MENINILAKNSYVIRLVMQHMDLLDSEASTYAYSQMSLSIHLGEKRRRQKVRHLGGMIKIIFT